MKIICVDNSGFTQSLSLGKKYRVLKEDEYDAYCLLSEDTASNLKKCYVIEDEEGDFLGYRKNRFKRV